MHGKRNMHSLPRVEVCLQDVVLLLFFGHGTIVLMVVGSNPGRGAHSSTALIFFLDGRQRR